ncbi:endopeptidase La [Helicobacter mustelae]|uniref:Lon protease n=1 Tax=Helicobacter mustelae (strain ATCC 43772 / CCUG 25715 / CIP 103759 / LMG 18044 / NCTC 12198 / R85-136P) TaxID=679897 RepID=D3UGD5_HELM1|nr:endopeptidase La [Helicobacter mustelae]CBG39556.1 ATP-dependent protease La [Helicobacter mustelae 12198]SQH71068.1 ATP-dependent protease La [Helicobacter mustelae]
MQLKTQIDFPTLIPILIEEEGFMYPFMIAPIFISDNANIKAVNRAMENREMIFVGCAKNIKEHVKNAENFYDVGVIGNIMRKVNLPDGKVKILFQGITKGKILSIENHDPLEGMVDIITYKEHNHEKIQATMEVLREKVRNLANISQFFPPDILRTIDENEDPNRVVDLIASILRLKKEQSYHLFASDNTEKRLLMLIDFIIEETQTQKLQKEIKNKVHTKMEQTNKEYFLREQLKQIQKELGLDKQRDEEIENYHKKLESIKSYVYEDTYKEIKKQIDRLNKMHQDSADANMVQNYIEWVLEIPFDKFAKKKLSINNVEKQLDIDHFSLKKPKERIVEFFAVKELLAQRNEKTHKSIGTILCFYGPPGVGKTSLANSIATAIGRPLVRIALGGLEDVNELRGHRRTYLGAMPGRIIQGLIEAKTMNPVVVLDEIDKVGRNMRGDPTSALLEILDPEQNQNFRDYYANFNTDLSQIIFIATANDIGNIPPPLRDRMEFIEVSSYTPQEKEQIAKNYLIPQELKKHGLKNSEISISSDAIVLLIEKYTREAGVRNLRRQIATLARKTAREILQNGVRKVTITPQNLANYLDKIVFEIEKSDNLDKIGIINGLAWTSVGGDVLKIEAIKIKGRGMLTLTGSLGDVMKESARIAFSVIKVLIDENFFSLKINKTKSKKSRKKEANETVQVYNLYDIHLHVPEGATPKDGPSAGIAMASVIASILTDSKIHGSIAMTGEITLTGEVLPIGGLKEKLIAAHKAGIKRALIPKKNYERDLQDIPQEVQEELEIISVKNIKEVLKYTLLKI